MSNVQLAKNIYAAFGRGDIPTVLAALHPEIEWRQAEGNPYQPTGAAWVGPQTVLEKLFMRLPTRASMLRCVTSFAFERANS